MAAQLHEYTSDCTISFIDLYEKTKRNFPQVREVNKEERLEKILCDNEVPYECKGYVEYAKGIQFLRSNSDILLLSSDLEGVGLGTKVYDYIFCNKPIIFVGSETTALASFVSSFTNGFVCTNKTETFGALEKIISEKIDALDDNIDVYSFSRGKQNERYINPLYS